jgi:hypothetical protein
MATRGDGDAGQRKASSARGFKVIRRRSHASVPRPLGSRQDDLRSLQTHVPSANSSSVWTCKTISLPSRFGIARTAGAGAYVVNTRRLPTQVATETGLQAAPQPTAPPRRARRPRSVTQRRAPGHQNWNRLWRYYLRASHEFPRRKPRIYLWEYGTGLRWRLGPTGLPICVTRPTQPGLHDRSLGWWFASPGTNAHGFIHGIGYLPPHATERIILRADLATRLLKNQNREELR